ncbi:Phosphotransferase enzyme protein [Pyrenophora tritici-repentis]|uniref:Phosphotransferase enzyme protein n=2 Tax=Pyrenophora tritici-repentis TaxID=45151 RepID=A0A922ND17_9PLEO|nr:Phosphotransferase enzyme protein [Pyrenophora tritici-repentis]
MSTFHISTTVGLANNKDASPHVSDFPKDTIIKDIHEQEVANATEQDENGEGYEKNEDTDDDDDDDDGGDDAASECPTILNGEEPFETFQHKVREQASKLFQKQQSDVVITQMKGGTYNRVVGVTISSKLPKYTLAWLKSCLSARRKNATIDSTSYIIRIPRTEATGDDSIGSLADDMKQGVAILNTVKSCLSLPTPEVVSYDLTTDNVFGRPYMVQKRLPGKNLQFELWNRLNLEQKKSVVKQVANLPSIIASIQGPAGDISSDNLSCAPNLPILIDKFHKLAYSNQPTPGRATTGKPLKFLLECINHWRAYQTAKQGFCFEDVWDAFEIIAKSLEKHGILDGPCVLVHRDLEPYNLLAEIRSDTEVNITAVIDWDFAVIAPEFMAYPAPFWSWLPDNITEQAAGDEEVFCLSVKPNNRDAQVIKQTFDANTSEKHKMYAFSMEAILARRMFVILHDGIFGPWPMSEATSIIVHYRELHPEDGIEYDNVSEYEVEKARMAIAQYRAGYED